MSPEQPNHRPTRHLSETILWAWLIVVALAGVIGAGVFFVLTYF